MYENIKSPRKLIEVALPLDAINEACAYEKMPGIGAHPRGIHLWWARRPLAATRAVIFAQLVNDPGFQQGNGFRYGKNKKEAAEERKRLFKIIEDLVKWENSENEQVLNRARAEIQRSWREVCELNKDHPQAKDLFDPNKLPMIHDPFAGGGAIPLEAQRLGLASYASDLNPVAVIINKAMIEIPQKFNGLEPVGPTDSYDLLEVDNKIVGSEGLAEDVRRYGNWMLNEAKTRIGHLYPKIEITPELSNDRPDLNVVEGKKLPIIAWFWARTVKSPNPAFSHVDVPLAATFTLSSKKGREVYVQPIINNDNITFEVKIGVTPATLKSGTKVKGGTANFRCLISNSPISAEYIRSEAQAGRMGQKLMGVVADGTRGRVYLSPTQDMERLAQDVIPEWEPDTEFFQKALGFRIGNYGMSKWSDLYTARQKVALSTFSNLVQEARSNILQDAKNIGMKDDGIGLEAGGKGATAYAEAVSVYLALAINRLADFGCSLATWKPSGEQVMHLFTRQAIPMTWDFPESNFLGDKSICLSNAIKYTVEGLLTCPASKYLALGHALQSDAQKQTISDLKFISTDPPYYDNIGYADLSDFFYVWLRKSLRPVFPTLLSTITVPKSEELVATPIRNGNKEQAEIFFMDGMSKAIHNLAQRAHPEGPITIYYAFKQSETNGVNSVSSTGWDTFLNAIISSGLCIVGTWPLRSEQEYRMRSMGSNALASSIVLVCRKRPNNAPTISRREFMRELNKVLPEALDEMTRGTGDEISPVAPVDLSQAIIGPGMAIFSKYSGVLEADGSQMSVKTALQLVNRFLAGDDFDADTQFCLDWFEQFGWKEGNFGEADVLARSKTTSVNGIAEAGVVESGGGSVRLKKWAEYPSDWNPSTDKRLPVWEVLHQLIRALKQEGESGAGRLLTVVKGKSEAVRQLAYRLYTLCERKGWAEDARAYNELITSWSGIESVAGDEEPIQGALFE